MGIYLSIVSSKNKKMTYSSEQIERAAKKEWTKIAGESLRIEVVSGTCYAFGSELACLRLYKAFKGNATVLYSQNLSEWFFRIGK